MSIDLAQSARWRTLALPNLFERGGLKRNQPALVFQNSAGTYGEMRNQMRRVARGIHALGIRPGDRVVVLSTNRLDYLEI